MKRISGMLTFAAFIFFTACNSGEDKEPIATNEASSTLFKLVMIQHPVADFDKWKSGYMSHDSVRKAFGLSHFGIGRGTDDPTMAIVFNTIDNKEKAAEFASLPELKDAMEKAGVTGSPTFTYVDVIRNDTSKIDQKEMVMIAHRVKDFDAWLKVFDEEGTAKRKEFGLIDRDVARGSDNPSMVYIVFAIADKEKATARMNSEELKKTMTDAGVEGAPQFMYFSLAE